MLLHDKIVWYDKVLRHHATRMLSGFYSRDGWAHVARVYGVDNELLKLLTKPKRMTIEENKMILDSMVYAARELERFHMLHMSDGYSLRWYANQVFPAYAGMFLGRFSHCPQPYRFPRIRGDVPSDSVP